MIERRSILRFVALMVVAYLQLVQGYLPSGGGTVNDSVHGKILRDGLEYLAYLLRTSTGLNETFTTAILENEEALYQGLGAADWEAGSLFILGGKMPRNELSHFFNPATNQGYAVGRYVKWIRQLQKHGWLWGVDFSIVGSYNCIDRHGGLVLVCTSHSTCQDWFDASHGVTWLRSSYRHGLDNATTCYRLWR
jgi:hypothetical protein